MNSLPEAIEALYFAFRDVPKPREIEGCPCCIDDKDIGTLLSVPLRELTARQLSAYASSAFLTVGEEADYLYFLPRILEMSCADTGWWPDIEVTGRAVGETRPLTWPESRREALVDVLRAAVGRAMENENGRGIDEWLCAIAKMGLDVGVFLEQIAQSPKAMLAYHEQNSQALAKRKLGNAFWDAGEPGYEEIMAWFQSPMVSRMISDGYGEAAK